MSRFLFKPNYEFERALPHPVAGVDEAGRGPWAGPVVAAAVILNSENIPAGLNDSKKLSAVKRGTLFPLIMAHAHVGIGISSVAEIDALNIRQATHLAMRRALEALPGFPAAALIDGNDAPKLTCTVQTLVKGDSRSLSIAAASIIAKVHRDQMMQALAQDFPGYGWERNAGYGTAAHASALARLGVTDHHRRSFAPIKALLTIETK